MLIKNIHLENIKVFEKFDLSLIDENTGLPHKVVLLTGENGTGKTTLLKAIASAFTVNNRMYGGDVLQEKQVTFHKDLGCIEIGMVLSEEEKINIHQSYDRNINAFEVNQYIVLRDGVEWRNEKLLRKNDNCLYGVNGKLFNYSVNIEIFQKSDYTGSVMLYFDVYRIVPPNPVTGPNMANLPQNIKEDALAPSLNKHNTSERFQYVKQWFVNLDFKEDKLYRQTGQDTGLMLEVTNALNLLLAPYSFSRVTHLSQVLIQTPNGEVEIEEVSEGMKSVFTILGEMLFRFSMPYMNADLIDTRKILETEAVVLIDEIDCHLHPKWQMNMIPALRKLFPNVQFIMTTHAPLVVSSVYPDEVFRLGGA